MIPLLSTYWFQELSNDYCTQSPATLPFKCHWRSLHSQIRRLRMFQCLARKLRLHPGICANLDLMFSQPASSLCPLLPSPPSLYPPPLSASDSKANDWLISGAHPSGSGHAEPRSSGFPYSASVSFSNFCFPLRSPLKVCVSCFSFLPCRGNLPSASIKVIITSLM